MKRIFMMFMLATLIMPLMACSKEKKEFGNLNSDNSYTVENSSGSNQKEPQSSTNESSSSQNNTVVDDQSKVEDPIENENSNDGQQFTNDDKEVISYFNQLKINVDEELNSGKPESVKDKLKGTFITVVDFIFYEGEIKGITFDELTEGAKQNILETATTIDNAIMKKFPNYKEEISDTTSKAYNKASELIKKGANNIKDFSREKLGEENYNSIIEVKDELVNYTKGAFDIVGDVASTIWDKGTEKVKNWYEAFKNN